MVANATISERSTGQQISIAEKSVGRVDVRKLESRWGDGLGGGFVALPNVLLQHQATLGLDCEQVVVLTNLLSHWWDSDEMPFPRSESLARRTGLSRRTVQRRLSQLEEKGFIKRLPRVSDDDQRALTQYDMKGVVEKLKTLGQAARDERANNALRKSSARKSAGLGSPAQESAV